MEYAQYCTLRGYEDSELTNAKGQNTKSPWSVHEIYPGSNATSPLMASGHDYVTAVAISVSKIVQRELRNMRH